METIKEKLMRVFPTPELFQAERDKFETWLDMATELGISTYSLFRHKKVLGMAPEIRTGRKPKVKNTIDANFKKVTEGKSNNTYASYIITDPETFFNNPQGYEGLKFVGHQQGKTGMKYLITLPIPYLIKARYLINRRISHERKRLSGKRLAKRIT